MKLTLCSFGPIDRAEIDLRDDFILIVGVNSVGKSYAVSAVYAVVKALQNLTGPYGDVDAEYYYGRRVSVRRFVTPRRPIEAAASELARVASEKSTRDISSEIEALLRETLQRTFIALLKRTLVGTFGDLESLQNRKQAQPLELRIETSDLRLVVGVEGGDLQLREVRSLTRHVLKAVAVARTLKTLHGVTTVYASTRDPEHLRRNLARLISRTMKALWESTGGIEDLYYLPASRAGLYQALSAFGQIVAELSKSRSFLSRRIELPGIREPLSDYFIRLSEYRAAGARPVDSPYLSAARDIEEQILHGKIEIDPDTKQLIFLPDGIDLRLDLAAASSMQAEIATIAAYLKYVLPTRDRVSTEGRENAPKQLLIIEEPEAHVHPLMQLKLTETLAKLVASGATKVFITSHSNYIFGQLSNLAVRGDFTGLRLRALVFDDTPMGGKSRTLEVGEFGIADENFVDVSEQLYEERVRLLSVKQ